MARFVKGQPRPVNAGRKPGSPRTKVDATLRERLEAAMDGRPLPLVLAMVGLEARRAGDYAVAVKALDAAASYAYAKPAPTPPAPDPATIRQPRILVIDPYPYPEPSPCPAPPAQ
jgi:hypothetical protein